MMPVKRRVYQQGNSLVVSIPQWMLDTIGVKKGDYIALVSEGKNKIVMHAVKLKDVCRKLVDNSNGG